MGHADSFSDARKDPWGQSTPFALSELDKHWGPCTSFALARPEKSVEEGHAHSCSKFVSTCANMHK